MDALYRVHDAEKLGLVHFSVVEASLGALIQTPNFLLLSKDAECHNKQYRVSEVILKHAYSVSAFATRLGNYNGILVAYQCHLLRSLSENLRLSPQLDELCLVNKNLLRVSKLNGQAVGRNLAALVPACRQLWHSQACVPDREKAPMLDALITPGYMFSPAVDEMLQTKPQAEQLFV
ncbi:UNVERIFIED_CONTAM: hypothetical protein FKN15_021623 [Acipenser sinensis]